MLVAITNDAAAAATVRLAHALAVEYGVVPTVLRVVHGVVGAAAGAREAGSVVSEDALIPPEQYAQLAALETQVQSALNVVPPWEYEVDMGATVPTILDRVQQLGAGLVILGLPHHTDLERAFMRDTVRGVVEHTRASVLAVHPALAGRPRSAMVALDFSPESIRAAHLAGQIVAPGGRLILVYVHPEISRRQGDVQPMGAASDDGIDAALALLVADLRAAKTVTVTSVVEWGSSIEGVRAAATRLQPDLVATGSGRHSPVDWFFGDSVSAAMINERRWSMLIVPA